MSPARHTDPAPARRAAYEILQRVESAGAWASVLLERHEERLADGRDAALLHEMVLGVLRGRAALDHALGLTAGRAVATLDVEVRTALRLGAYALLRLDRVPSHAAVDDSVELVKRGRRRAATGLVNAVLRKLATAGASALPRAPAEDDVAGLALFHSHPEWWVRRVVERYGWGPAATLLERQNLPAPVTLHASVRHGSTAELIAEMSRGGCRARAGGYAPAAVRVESGPAARQPALARGACWVQDEAAQLVGELACAGPEGDAIDLCAAPGGKSLQLAEAVPAGGTVVAVDRHHGRLRRLRRAAARVGAAEIVTVRADMTREAPFRRRFPRVLLDAPCSGSGTMRRRPEIRWRLEESDPAVLALRQRRLLERAAELTEPGGTLVYSVCSMEPEEGERVVEAFLAAHDEFRKRDPRPSLPAAARALVRGDGFLHTSALDDGLDGFFAALLERGRPAAGASSQTL